MISPLFNKLTRSVRSSLGTARVASLALPLVTLLALAPLSGCSDDDDSPMAPAPGDARVRVLHLSPDAPAVDVYLNQSLATALTRLEFPNGTPYLEVDPGAYDVAITAHGSPIGDAVLRVDDLNLAAETSYTAVALGPLANLQLLALEDDYAGIPEGFIRVRAIHAAVGVGQVDIWNVPATGSPTPLYENVDFGVAGQFLDLPAAAYTLGFDVDNDASPDVFFNLPALEAGTVVNVFAVTDKDANLSLRAQLPGGDLASVTPGDGPSPATTAVKILHLSPNAPAVDIYLDGSDTPAFEDLVFLNGTGFLELPAKTYRVDVSPANTSREASVLTVDPLTLDANVTYTAVAYDRLENISALPLVNDFSPVAPGQIRVRAIHTAAALDQVDIWNIPAEGTPTPLYPDLDFAAVGGYLTLPAGAYTLGVDVDNDAVPDVTFALPALPEGTVAEVFAVTDDAGTPFLRVLFADGSLATIDIQPLP